MIRRLLLNRSTTGSSSSSSSSILSQYQINFKQCTYKSPPVYFTPYKSNNYINSNNNNKNNRSSLNHINNNNNNLRLYSTNNNNNNNNDDDDNNNNNQKDVKEKEKEKEKESVDDQSGTPKWVPIPNEVVIFPVFERTIYPGAMASLPFDMEEYKRMGQPKEIGLFLVNPTVREEIGKDTKNFKLSSIDQLSPIGILVSVESIVHKPYIIGAARIQLDSFIENTSSTISTSTSTPTSTIANDEQQQQQQQQPPQSNIVSSTDNFKEEIVDTTTSTTSTATTATTTTATTNESTNIQPEPQPAVFEFNTEWSVQCIDGETHRRQSGEATEEVLLGRADAACPKGVGVGSRREGDTEEEVQRAMVKAEDHRGASEARLPGGDGQAIGIGAFVVRVQRHTDHYGLDDIKETIQSFIAVGKLRGSVGGKIILLVGPPGTGKTSIGKSIATALGRQFYRFSVGGISDVAEIKGHRRTFIGAMPGKIIQALKMVKTSNPVILIDGKCNLLLTWNMLYLCLEIDKISKGFQSDPYASLLEVFDAQQNSNFLDHYLDIPYDLSKVLFICTANLTHTIPAPLLDRMDVMKLNGYIQSEQIQITEKYLVPSIRSETGLKDEQVKITTDAIKLLCEFWCRESGVRNLKKAIERIFRRVAYKMVTEELATIEITPQNLEEYAGLPKYRTNKYYQNPQAGITLGLAWSENGGVPLYIESVIDRYQETPGLRTTGSLGEVMKESIDIAYTYVKQFYAQLQPDSKFFDKNAIHIHAPEGAQPKDGPSAGITMITSLLSLALNRPIQPGIAMTGEITLTGKVIAVGGITEKMIAAKREGVKRIILPKDNKKELEEIPEFVKEGFSVYLVEYYRDVFDIAFNENPSVQPLAVTSRKKKDFSKKYPSPTTESSTPPLSDQTTTTIPQPETQPQPQPQTV
ncbi:peptidase S16 [Heterostelium album PN500]|uniref:Lon protease homolog n=1 Tax=Heterostelium pallidum (strain ATCC 26659 / Pp 5 / PN500) TaxID=670386 RepID=D3B0I3_HETP5|nr:peptidase S16 [Heterostelium album PN500]EFA84807.1 peptidase S16 [Heterostelium album PN500]|eukprot:XP_020436918.1 peptidase S16 [Heterostelium album PN500]